MGEKKEVKKIENPKIVKPKMRQIIIETDGDSIKVVKSEVSGSLEFIAILNSLIAFLSKK